LASTSHDNSLKFYDVSQFIRSRIGIEMNEGDEVKGEMEFEDKIEIK
jgi:hypothetical protein